MEPHCLVLTKLSIHIEIANRNIIPQNQRNMDFYSGVCVMLKYPTHTLSSNGKSDRRGNEFYVTGTDEYIK